MRGLRAEKEIAEQYKRLGVLCLFCYAELTQNKHGRKIEICGKRTCKQNYFRAYMRDYRNDVFQDAFGTKDY